MLSRAAVLFALAGASFATPLCTKKCQDAAPKSFEVVGAGLDGNAPDFDNAPDVNGRYVLDSANTAGPDPDRFPQYIAEFKTPIPYVIIYAKDTSGSGLRGWVLCVMPASDQCNAVYFVADPHGQEGPPANNWQALPVRTEGSVHYFRPAPHLNYGGLSTVGTMLLAVIVVGVVGVGIGLVAAHQKKQRRIRDALAANPPPPAGSLQRHQPEASTAPLLPPAHVASPPAYGAVSQQSGRGGSQMTIENLLTDAKLSQYATAFNEAGCVEVDDIHDMADDDLQGIGLKGPEIKRLRRKVGAA